ncbi:MAG TPA: AbrB family transcriptional regulator [Patescibacteria group bacterium]|nr:AbrB family transcriptional regulator [Patescibacteria group bacterium]
MIQGIQKIIRIGSSEGLTLPVKDLRREGLGTGDEVEFIVRPVSKTQPNDEQVIRAARKILTDYKKDFKNLADR